MSEPRGNVICGLLKWRWVACARLRSVDAVDGSARPGVKVVFAPIALRRRLSASYSEVDAMFALRRSLSASCSEMDAMFALRSKDGVVVR